MLSPRRLLAILRKEFRHITRDARVLFLVTFAPAILLVVLAYLFALDAGTVDLVWFDGDNTPGSRAYLRHITADGAFRLVEVARDYAGIEEALRAGRADVALVVPPGFGADVLARRTARAQAIADGSDSIAAQQALGNLAARTGAYGAGLAGATLPVEARTRAWYNGSLKSLWSMVPGLMAIVFSLSVLALTLAVKREEELGTMEALVASPVRGAEYQLGKLLAYVIAGLVAASLAAAVAVFWFGVPLRGGFGLFLLLTALYYLAGMGIALLIARFVSSQQTAMQLVLLIFFIPGFFISGLILPVNTDSPRTLITAYALPGTHFMAIARGIFLKGLGPAELALHVRILGLLAAVSLALSLTLFRKRVG